MLDRLPRRVSVVEVSPRDGLQNESAPIDTEGKLRLVNALVQSGLKRVELTSFVSPRWVPQLADAEEIARRAERRDGVVFSALCPNSKGLERAISAGLDEVAVFLSSSETHNKRNTNKSIKVSLETFAEVIEMALSEKLRVRAYISTVWGCPYEGETDPARALAIAPHRRFKSAQAFAAALKDVLVPMEHPWLRVPSSTLPNIPKASSMPQIAYVLAYGFRLAGSDIPALQQRHADLCESKGPLVCRIVSLNQSTDTGDESAGTLQLAVAASEARAFGKQLTTAAENADAEQFSAAISGEDLSKQIVDTEARLRARTLLRDRLMEVLATRRGTVTELVEAERGVAQVNEEIDQARSWLTQMKGRVAFSQIDIEYQSAVAQQPTRGFMDPVRGAVSSLGTIFGSLLAVLIVLGAIGAPVLGGVLGVRQIARRISPAPREAEA